MLAALAALLVAVGSPRAQGSGPRLEQVATLRTIAPATERFLLRGTVPIPAGVYPRADGLNPFLILAHDGTPRPTQTEVVSRRPDASAGADVVELLALVERPPGVDAGTPVEYAVALTPTPESLPPGPYLQTPDVLRDLLTDTDGIRIIAYDCFGNRYLTRPLSTTDFDVVRDGPMQRELRVHQVMMPETVVPGSTLPHLLGVHAYFSWFRRSSTLGLDLRFHNAHDGHDKSDPSDDPLDTVYFERIEVSIPAGWTMMQDFDDPLFGASRVEGGRRIVQVVEPLPAGKMHVMRWHGQFHRRLALAPDDPESRAAARSMLDGAGRAYCVAGSVDGRPLWSWWNRATAGYFPQRNQLPSLEHVGRPALRAQLAGTFGGLRGHFTAGTGTGAPPVVVGRLGWGHPYGSAYGGVTGGEGIVMWEGIEAAWLADPVAFRLYSLLHRMQTDRMPNAMFQLDGSPSSVDEWRIDAGSFFYVPFEFYGVPLISGSRPEPFGLRDAPTFQVDHVRANGLQPGYESQHFAFDPYDLQHLVRYTRAAKVLAWLHNDSLAKDDLRMQAETYHLTFHSDANSAGGGFQGSGMRSVQRYVKDFPGKGIPFGRGESWGLDCAAAVYSMAEDAWRARKLPWLQDHAELLLAGQGTCNGFIQSIVSNKAFDGRYAARQQIEQSITEHALRGLARSVFLDTDPSHGLMVKRVLEKSLYAFISEMAWFPGQPGPYRYTGVGPVNPALPTWCSLGEIASDAFTAGDIEGYQDWSSFAYGFELTQDTAFLVKARDQIGATDFAGLVQRLTDDGTENIGNRAALLALVQRLTGVL